MILTGPNIADNSDVNIILTHFDADGNNVADLTTAYARRAGDYIAIGLGAQQHSESFINELQGVVNDAAIAQANGLPFDPDDLLGGLLHQGAAKWFHNVGIGEDVVNGLTSAVGTFDTVDSGLTTADDTSAIFADLQNPFVLVPGRCSSQRTG